MTTATATVAPYTRPELSSARWRSWGSVAVVPVVIALLALVVYLPGFWWGAPSATASDRVHAWGVDDETPLGPLNQVHGIVQPQGAVRNPGYPLMHSLIVAAADSPYLVFLWLSGGLVGISATFPYGLVDPVSALRTLTLIPHFVSVLMGVGIVAAAFIAGRTLWNVRVGLLAGLFAMLSYPMFYYARTGNPDVPVLFFTALALAVFARCMLSGVTPWRATWLGIFVGLAVATKEPAFASFLGVPVVLIWQQARRDRGLRAATFWKAVVLAMVAAVVAFGLGSGLFVDHQFYLAHLAFATNRAADGAAGLNPFAHPYPNTIDGDLGLAGLMGQYVVDAVTLPGVILAVVGLVWALRNERLTAAFALPALTYVLVLFVSARTAQLRYLMPVALTLAFFAARAVVAGWDTRHRLSGVSILVLALGALILSAVHGLDLTYAMLNDSHYAAADWLAGRVEPGDRVEYFGFPDQGRGDQHLPALPAGVITAPALPGDVFQQSLTDDAILQEVRDGWDQRQPRFVILTPDYLSPPGSPYSGACPPRVCQALLDGAMGYHQVAVFGPTPSLVPWIARPALDYPVVDPPIRIFIRDKEQAT